MLRSANVLVVLFGFAAEAYANPADIVPGGQDPTDPTAEEAQKSVDIYGQVDYSYELDSASIVRERVGAGSDPNAGVPTVKDLDFKQFKHTITPSLHVGIFRDTFFYAALPIVITQVRELSLAPGGNRASSSTVTSGILPESGFDARDPGTPTAGDLMFRGPARKGLDQVYLGLGGALMNQVKDPTKPTWKLGAEVRLAIGTPMAFDPTAPNKNKSVSQGVHELKLWTSFTKKLGWAEPWVDLSWTTPLSAKTDSLFQDPGFGSKNTKKSQQASVGFGLELYALDNPEDQTRISLDFGTRETVHFEGREYSEMWEVFAFAGEARGTGPLILDSDPTRPDVQALSHPGITNVENYLDSHGLFAIRAQLGPHVRFAISGDINWKTDHAITFADAGIDGPDDNDLINPNTAEVNPLHVSSIDLVGHRYRAEDGFDVAFGVMGQVLF